MLGEYCKQYEKLVEHWKTSIDIQVLELHHEDIINDQETAAHTLLEF